MPVLKDLKLEQFSQHIAAGCSNAEAALKCGACQSSTRSTARATGSRLHRIPAVQARIDELTARKAEIVVQTAGINIAWVVERLVGVARQAEEKEDLSTARLAYRDIGQHLGMFREGTDKLPWNGDPNTLSQSQFVQLMAALEQMAYGDDIVAKMKDEQAIKLLLAKAKEEEEARIRSLTP